MKASVIIITWNKKDLLKNCLDSLEKQSCKNFKTIVVDNDSKDKTIEFIKKYYPKTKIINLKKNFGFSIAANIGIKASKSEYFILLNNDTVVDKDFVKYLIESLDNNQKYCACTAKIIDFFNKNVLASAGDSMNNVGQSFSRGLGDKANRFNKPEEVFLVTGGASIFRKRVFEKIGYFDEDYIFSGEDSDWCFRAQLAGYKFFYEPKAIVYHHGQASSKSISKIIDYFHFRNMTITILKTFPTKLFFKRWRFILIPLVHLNMFFCITLKGHFKEAIKADFWIIKHLRQIFIKRLEIQSKRKVSIEYINSWLEPKKIRLFNSLNE
jgi:GT2 family glycosyltransferase